MKRQFLAAIALSLAAVASDVALAANNNTNTATNKVGNAAPIPQPSRAPIPSQLNGNNSQKANSSSSSAANKGSSSSGSASKKGASSGQVPGYYNNATGSYYPDGYGPNNPKPSASASNNPDPYNYNGDYSNGNPRDRRYSGYYGNYPGYGYNSGYYNGYGNPYGTTPYGLGYNAYGQPYLYPVYPSYGYGYGYGYAYGPPVYGAYYGNPFASTGRLFGPGPILQMMGVDQWANPNGGVGGNPNINGANAGQNNAQANAGINGLANGVAGNNAAGNNVLDNNAAAKDAAKQADRPPPGRAAAVTWKFITFGDGYFAKQKYMDANERYRTASRQTNTVPEAWFRQGFALAALGKYDQAAKAFHRGLEINPDWATTDFHLNDLYGSDDAEKKSKLDAMTAAAVSQPNDPDIAFVLGVHLYFDGQPDKAAPFFRKAAQISGSDLDVKGFVAAK